MFSTEARRLSKGRDRSEAAQSGAKASTKIDVTVQGAFAKVGLNPKSTSIQSHTITCDYVVAADGTGSKIRSMVGLGLSGRQGIAHLVNVHFRCEPLARLLRIGGPRPPGMLYFVYNEVRGGGVVILLTCVNPSPAADQFEATAKGDRVRHSFCLVCFGVEEGRGRGEEEKSRTCSVMLR